MFGLFSDDSSADKRTESASLENAEDASTSTAANPLLNLWSVATAVTNTVKARADELVKSVVDTDWRNELSQFSREVGEESKTLKEKTAELVEHLPEQVVHLPEKAEEALQHLPEKVHLPKDVGQTLEGVGVAFAQIGKSLLQGTRELIDELKEGVETEIAAASREGKRAARGKSTNLSAAKLSTVAAKYNRFEAEVAAMQRDSSTYCDEPEDTEDYARWKAGFSLEGVKADIARIMSDNTFMAELQSRLVPIIVENEDFWHRYFYRLHKLQQKEEQRQQLTQRAKTLQEDEVPLGWGDEDEVPVPSPGANEGQAASSSAAPAPVSEPAAAAAGGEAKPAEPADTPAAEEQPTPMSEPAGASDTGAEQKKGAEPAAAAATAAVAAAVGSSPVPSVAAEQADGALRKLQSSGGASSTTGSAALHVDADEAHAETASDSSAKEWCVVSSDAQQATQTPSTAAAAPVEAPAEGEAPQPSESPERPSAGGAGQPAAGPSPAAAAPAAAMEAAAASEGGEAGTKKALEAAKEAKGPARQPGDGGEEELDEDWGNWD